MAQLVFKNVCVCGGGLFDVMFCFQATQAVQLQVQAEFRKKFVQASFRDYKSWMVKEVTSQSFRFNGIHLMASKESVTPTSFSTDKFVGKGKVVDLEMVAAGAVKLYCLIENTSTENNFLHYFYIVEAKKFVLYKSKKHDKLASIYGENVANCFENAAEAAPNKSAKEFPVWLYDIGTAVVFFVCMICNCFIFAVKKSVDDAKQRGAKRLRNKTIDSSLCAPVAAWDLSNVLDDVGCYVLPVSRRKGCVVFIKQVNVNSVFLQIRTMKKCPVLFLTIQTTKMNLRPHHHHLHHLLLLLLLLLRQKEKELFPLMTTKTVVLPPKWQHPTF